MRLSGINKTFKGFTIIEILIAIIIIGILVAIIIPRLATRADLARRRAAESDIEEIRKAQEHAGIDTGYYYRLYVLDDNPGGDGYGRRRSTAAGTGWARCRSPRRDSACPRYSRRRIPPRSSRPGRPPSSAPPAAPCRRRRTGGRPRCGADGRPRPRRRRRCFSSGFRA